MLDGNKVQQQQNYNVVDLTADDNDDDDDKFWPSEVTSNSITDTSNPALLSSTKINTKPNKKSKQNRIKGKLEGHGWERFMV